MRIWEHTFEELTGGRQPYGKNDQPFAAQPFMQQHISPIPHKPGIATAPISGEPLGNQALLELRDGQWMCVGHYVEDTILLEPDTHVRGQGLGEELLLRCVEHRDQLPLSSNFTDAGYKLLRRAHQLAIKRALEATLTVPDAVVAEYESQLEIERQKQPKP